MIDLLRKNLMLELYQNIKKRRLALKMSQQELADKLGYTSRSSIAKIEAGKVDIPQSKIQDFATALRCTPADLMGWNQEKEKDLTDKPDYSHVHNVIPLPISTKQVLLYDGIACGEPKFADGRMADMISLPEGVNADFAIVCHGDSMINLRIKDGDIVFIRDQQDVDDGEVAAVLIEDDATLKKVYHKPYGLLLMPANENYEPQIYTPEQMLNIRIMGKAIAFLSPVE